MAERKEQIPEVNSLAGIDPLIHDPARLMVITYLYVIESIDFVNLKQVTGLSWGNLSTHLTQLEDAGYISIKKTFQDNKPHTMIQLTESGRDSFREYKDEMQRVLGNLPD